MRVYEEIDYAAQRLKHTIVRYDGSPVYINEIYMGPGGVHVVEFSYLNSGVGSSCKLQDLDIDPVPLGYCNYQAIAYYLCRMPMREDWRQGLRETSLRTWDGAKFGLSTTKPDLHRTITGDYPSLAVAKKKLSMLPTGGNYSYAFSREFAVGQSEQLYYRGKHTIGKIGSLGYELNSKFEWVEDLLERALK